MAQGSDANQFRQLQGSASGDGLGAMWERAGRTADAIKDGTREMADEVRIEAVIWQ